MLSLEVPQIDQLDYPQLQQAAASQMEALNLREMIQSRERVPGFLLLDREGYSTIGIFGEQDGDTFPNNLGRH